MDFKERIELLIKELNIRSIFEFVKKTDLGGGTINKIKNRPSENTIQKILKVYPNINREWLEFGSGEMFKSKPYPIEENNDIHVKEPKTNVNYGKIEVLEKEIEKLKEIIKEKDIRIQDLKENINDLRSLKNITYSESDKQTT